MACPRKFYVLLVRSVSLLVVGIFVFVQDETLAVAANSNHVFTENVAPSQFAVIASDTGKSIAILIGVLAMIGAVMILLDRGGKSGD